MTPTPRKPRQRPASTPARAGTRAEPDVQGMTVKGRPATADQRRNAQTIIDVGRRRGATNDQIVGAIACATQESRLINLQGGDRDSGGLFQQRPSMGWGTRAQVTNPEHAAGRFFDAFLPVCRTHPGRGIGWLVSQTQRDESLNKRRQGGTYQQWVNEARRTVAELGGGAAPRVSETRGPSTTGRTNVPPPPATGTARHPTGHGPPVHTVTTSATGKVMPQTALRAEQHALTPEMERAYAAEHLQVKTSATGKVIPKPLPVAQRAEQEVLTPEMQREGIAAQQREVDQQQPAGDQPQPAVDQPQHPPVAEQSSPATGQPQAVTDQPPPVPDQPQPAGDQPQPAGDQPQPAGDQPQPAGDQPQRAQSSGDQTVSTDATGQVIPKPSPVAQHADQGVLTPEMQAAAIAAQPQPAGDQPQPAGDQPQPAGDQPQPAGDQPQPAGDQPQPAGDQPQPAGDQPQPAGDQPQPAGDQPQPAGDQPQPAGDQPQPAGDQPQPAGDQPQRAQSSGDQTVSTDATGQVIPKPSPVAQHADQGVLTPEMQAAAIAAQPQPAGDQPQPAGDQPQPAGDQPQPAGDQPQPAGDQPQPAGDQPQPAGDQPQPAGDQPQPAQSSGDQTVSTDATGQVIPKPSPVAQHADQGVLTPEMQAAAIAAQPQPAGDQPQPAQSVGDQTVSTVSDPAAASAPGVEEMVSGVRLDSPPAWLTAEQEVLDETAVPLPSGPEAATPGTIDWLAPGAESSPLFGDGSPQGDAQTNPDDTEATSLTYTSGNVTGHSETEATPITGDSTTNTDDASPGTTPGTIDWLAPGAESSSLFGDGSPSDASAESAGLDAQPVYQDGQGGQLFTLDPDTGIPQVVDSQDVSGQAPIDIENVDRSLISDENKDAVTGEPSAAPSADDAAEASSRTAGDPPAGSLQDVGSNSKQSDPTGESRVADISPDQATGPPGSGRAAADVPSAGVLASGGTADPAGSMSLATSAAEVGNLDAITNVQIDEGTFSQAASGQTNETFAASENPATSGGPVASEDAGIGATAEPSGGGDPTAGGGDPNAGGGDPNAGGGDPNAGGGDPNAGGGDPNAGGGDPNAGGGDPNAGGGDPNAGGGDPNAGGGDPNAAGGYGDPNAGGGGDPNAGGGTDTAAPVDSSPPPEAESPAPPSE